MTGWEPGTTPRQDRLETEKIGKRSASVRRASAEMCDSAKIEAANLGFNSGLADSPVASESGSLPAMIEAEQVELEAAANDPHSSEERCVPQATTVRELFDSAGAPECYLNLAPGDAVDHYRIERLIGRGAYGFVFAARDQHTQRLVAVKILRPDWKTACGDDFADRFRDEARYIRDLVHPAIVPLLGVGEFDGLPFHVLGYVDGSTLNEFVGQRILCPAAAARIISQVASAVHFTHRQGIVHRDLKPSNILIAKSGKVYVTDFGIALTHAEQGSGPSYVGTPLYMSPEQARGNSHQLDGRADVFSLGVILYELATGMHPFGTRKDSAETLAQRTSTSPAAPLRQRADVPIDFEHICLKALAVAPEGRYRTALDLASDLNRFVHRQRAQRFLHVGSVVLGFVAACLLALKLILPAIWEDWFERDSHTVARAKGSERLLLSRQDLHALDASLASILRNGVAGATDEETRLAAAMILARLRSSETVEDTNWNYFGSGRDCTLQSALMSTSAASGLAPKSIIQRLRSESRADVRTALLLALGGYSCELFTLEDREQLVPELTTWFAEDADAGVHSACDWLLRRWGYVTQLQEALRGLQCRLPSADFNWCETLPDLCMIACRQSSFGQTMRATSNTGTASPACESPAFDYDFAVSSKEISQTQWDWVNSIQPQNTAAERGKLPRNHISWHEAAGFCNQLSKVTGVPEHEYCYERVMLPDGKFVFREYPDVRDRRGFRLPTPDEWEYISRAGSTTRRHWGHSDSYLAEYANCRPLSREMPLPVGSLKPNRAGFFDTLGNVSEWIHGAQNENIPALVDLATRSVPLRGGSAWTGPAGVTVDSNYTLPANDPGIRVGLRVVQNLLTKPRSKNEVTVALRSGPGNVAGDANRNKSLNMPASCSVIHDQLISDDQVFSLGRISRGNDSTRWLLISNHTEHTIAIVETFKSKFAGCNFDGLTIEPRQSKTVQFDLDQVCFLGWQTCLIKFGWQASDGSEGQWHAKVAAYIEGPSVELMGDRLDINGNHRIDFGNIPIGCKIRHSFVFKNIGDQELRLGQVRVSECRERLHENAVGKLGPGESIDIELEMDTNSIGGKTGFAEVTSNDPAIPEIKLELRACVQDSERFACLGVFRDGTWLWDFDRDGTPECSLDFGQPDDTPLTGDFNGDGRCDLAVVRSGDRGCKVWNIRLRDAAGNVSIVERIYGDNEATVLAADMNGDARTDLISVQPAQDEADVVNKSLLWEVDTNGDDMCDDSMFFGQLGDVPIAGDWDGTCRAAAGVFRKSDDSRQVCEWLLKSRPCVSFGLSADIPLVGDWNGNGISDMGIYRVDQGQGLYALDVNSTPTAEIIFDFGIAGDLPVTGFGKVE